MPISCSSHPRILVKKTIIKGGMTFGQPPAGSGGATPALVSRDENSWAGR